MTLLDRIRPEGQTGTDGVAQRPFARVAIIDIGSNSVRLVVYDGPRRIPFILFNEKVMAGLGAELGKTGRIGADAMERSLRALARFRSLCADMEVEEIRCVATAAVREADNRADFLARVTDLGLTIRILSGEDEGRLSAAGLLSGMPDADGIMGDLGGGSLELVRVSDGRALQAISMPLGVLRIAEIRSHGKAALGKKLATILAESGWKDIPPGLPFYMVGGSWRALAKVDMHVLDYPLPIFHHYEMAPARVPALIRFLANGDRSIAKGLPSLSPSRVPMLPHAAALLQELASLLRSSRLVVSAFGLREGLLYQDLPPDIATQDPLLVAARAEGDAQGRFAGHGDLIDRWIAPLFVDDPAPMHRIRHAACLLADVGWRANPDFRAERGLETGVHGNWVGISAAERAMLGQALYTSLGGSGSGADWLDQLAGQADLARAVQWGLAIRLAQRLSGGVASALQRTTVALDDTGIVLRLPDGGADLIGEATERRLRQLGQAMILPHRITA